MTALKLNKKLIIIILVFILIIFVLLIINNKKDANLNINVAPSNTKILLDNKEIKAGKNYVSNGKHNLSFSRSGFANNERQININQNDINNVYIVLTPTTEEGWNYYNKNQDEFMKIEGLSGKDFTNKSKDATETYPIIKQLPFDAEPFYRVDYGISKKYPDDPTKIALYVSTSQPQSTQDALETIFDSGFDPSDYEIIFQPLEVSN